MENNFKVGDFIVYTDRDRYTGTIISLNWEKEEAVINVVLNIKDELEFERLTVPISKLKKRDL